MKINYKDISLMEIDRLSFLHIGTYDLVCDGDRKVIVLEKIGEDNE